MAIQHIDLTFNSNLTTSLDDKGYATAKATREFNVFVTNPQDDDSILRFSSALPKEGFRHPYYPFCFCDNVTIQRQGPRHFTYAATYASAPYKAKENPNGPPNPLNEPVQISYFTITNEGPCDEDITGKSIATATGELVYGITRSYSDLGIRLTKNFATFDPPSFYLFINTVNNNAYLGFPAGTLFIANISAEEQFLNETPYFRVSVEIHARKPYRQTNYRAWWTRYRHQGYRAFYLVNGQRVNEKITKNGEPVTTPALLKEDGFLLPDPAQGEPIANFREAQIYEYRNFNDMGF